MSTSLEVKSHPEGRVNMVEEAGDDIHNEKKPHQDVFDLIEAEKRLSVWQAAKTYKRILGYCAVAYICGMTYGYDTIANGATIAMPAFLLSFGSIGPGGTLFAPSVWTSLWIAMTNLGQAIGAFVAGPLAQRIGRRYAIITFALLTSPGVALQYSATSRAMLLGGKIFNGFCVGGLLAVGTTWASDVTPVCLRAPVLQGLVFFTVVMQGTSLGIVRAFVPTITPHAWKVVFGLQWLVGGLPLLAFFIPESPVWLLSKNRPEEAHKSLSRLYGKDHDLDARLQIMQETLEREKSSTGDASFIECFRGTNLLRTCTVSLLFFGNGLIGSAFLSQNIYFLLIAGLPALHTFDIGIGGFFLACIVIVASWFFTDKIGRRTLWLVGVVGNIIGMVIIGALAYSTNKGAIWGVAVIMNLLISWQIATCFNIGWAMAPEISSYRLRQHTQSIGYVVQAITSWLFQFTVPYMYNIDSGNLGAKTGFVFAGSSVLLLAISWFIVPETTGLTVEDIDMAYTEKVSPRKFSGRRNV